MRKPKKTGSQTRFRKDQETEPSLRESLEKFRLIAEKTADTITVLDMELNITYVSPSILRLRGYAVEEALTQRMDQIFTPESLIRIKEVYVEQLALEESGKADPNRSVTLELEELHKDGSVILVEVVISFIRDTMLKATGVLTVTRDITKRKLTEQRISQLAAIVESSDDAIFSKTLDGIITSWNKGAEMIYGYKEQEIVGKSVSKLILPEMQKEMSWIFEKISAGQHINHLETTRIRKDGQRINVSLTISPLIDINGRIIGASTIGYDITERIRSETALQKANEEMKRIVKFNEALLSAIPTPVFYKDREGRYMGCNRAFSDLMGVTPDQIKGKTVFELWPGEHAHVYHKKDLDLMNNPVRQIYEFKVKDKDGFERPVIYSKDVFYNENNQAEGIVGAFLDISDRKSAEQALWESSQMLRLVLNNMPSFVFWKDRNSVYLGCNYLFANNAGLDSTEDIIGKTDFDLPWKDTEAQSYRDDDRLVMETGQSKLNYEETQFTADGRHTWVRTSKIPLRDVKGEIIGVLGTFEDITERKQAQAVQVAIYLISEAAQTVSNLNELYSSIHAIIGELMPARNFFIALYNAATEMITFPYYADEFDPMPPTTKIGKGLTDYVIRTGKSLLVRPMVFEQLVQSGHVESIGTPSCDWLGVPLKNQQGETFGIMAIQTYNETVRLEANHKDIMEFVSTQVAMAIERKRAEEELIKAKEQAEESNRLKSAFLATMNHELRTPLNHILGFSDLIRSGAVMEQFYDYADVIYKSGQNLLEIIEDIFELALAEQSGIKLRLQTFKCLDLFIGNKAVLTEILEMSGKKDQIELVFNADKELLLQNITTDRNKINQVLINLFKNAVKFTRTGKIEFGLTKDTTSALVFYVEDTGIGIPVDKHGIIFEFFRQADDSHTREYGGVGIGLAISKKIAEVLQGSLSVESQPGKGSKFCLKIPVLLSERGLQAKSRTGKMTYPDLHNKTILIAEDDPISLELIKRMLTRTGVRLIEAGNGKEVIDLLNNNPDAILMDLNMPIMDGYTATRITKSKRPDIPVIAITAYALSEDRNKAMEAGCDGIISKPVDQQVLFNELRKYLLSGTA